MARRSAQELARAAWAVARRQHWIVTRAQLRFIGYSNEAIDHRIGRGRLHPVHAGVFAVGRAALTREGHFIAAVLACSPGAALSDHSAGELWGIVRPATAPIHVSVPRGHPRRPGIRIHRRTEFEITRRSAIPVTTVVCTLVQLADGLDVEELERAINEAVNRDLTDPERLREAVALLRHRRGARRVAELLDRDTYAVTESRLEQRFLRIVHRGGLPLPQTQVRRGGGRVDFYWPQFGLVVEADSLRYHRTPAQQRTDLVRDHGHALDGVYPLRFTHWQIFHDAAHVERTLVAVIRRAAQPTTSADQRP